jgi:polyphosphate kinase
MFPGRKVVAYSQFRVTRDADLWIDEEEVKNLRQALQGELPQRQFGSAVRLEVAAECPQPLAAFLLGQFGLTEADLYRCDGPVNIARLSSLIDQVDIDALKYEPFVPGLPARLDDAPDILSAIKAQDILLHHPYQSFEPVVEFIRTAADDEDVVAIKQTVYRTGVNSVLMEALIEAARRGKEVTVVVELMARFDEEANINWAERLERAGAQVVYGVFGLKTHAKLALVIRRERDRRGRMRLVPYAHLGTGNYHPRTTGLYTDFGLLTSDAAVCSDVNEVFLHITSLARASRMKRLMLAPFTMHRRVLELIKRETRNARDGRPARIIAKMNALVEEGVIRALYAASAAGVSIDLIVRGACSLRPGVPGVSDNIRVRSVLGRFLEHHRVWYFENDGTPDVWLSSADWMGRNMFRRMEVAFPVRDPVLRKRVVDEGLKAYLADNREAWTLDARAAGRKCGHAGAASGARRKSSFSRACRRRTSFSNAMAIDLASLWNHGKPELSEQRFREALQNASDEDALVLETQIARTYGLRRDFGRAREILSTIEAQAMKASPEVRTRYFLELGRTYASTTHPPNRKRRRPGSWRDRTTRRRSRRRSRQASTNLRSTRCT